MQLGALELALVCPPVSLGLEYMPFVVGLKDQRDGWPSAGNSDLPDFPCTNRPTPAPEPTATGRQTRLALPSNVHSRLSIPAKLHRPLPLLRPIQHLSGRTALLQQLDQDGSRRPG
jgi:hypothetical protein